MKKFSIEELGNFKGENGAPVYVAYQGKVYDVSESVSWENGMHQDEHTAGHDMTEEILDAPHEPDLLEQFPIVGELE